ncbi:MAG: glutamyl-tRNA reductase, partial [Clostridiales bacterium]
MKIGVIGIDHQCNAAIREKLSFTESSKMAFATDILGDIVDEVVILSTCNRSEVYFARYEDDDNIFKDLRRSYLKFFACPQYDGYLFQMEDRAALEHLFSVASGLSSAIVGEDEILHQTKSAYEFSRQLKYCGKLLNKIFQEALSCAKTIKNSLKISEIPLSSGYIGLKFLQERCGGF